MTHYANDFFDLEADRANRTPTRWSGGSRVLPDGVLPPRVALVAALVLGVVALAAALVLAMRAPELPLLLPLAVVDDGARLGLQRAAAAARGARPRRAARPRSWSRCASRCSATTCRRASCTRAIFAACALPCALQFAMLLAIEFPDAAGDAVAGKRTLVVRLGGGGRGAALRGADASAGSARCRCCALAARCRSRVAHRAARAGADRDLAGGARRARRLRRPGALGQRRVLVGGAADRQRGAALVAAVTLASASGG